MKLVYCMIAAASIATASTAAAGDLKLSIANGRATLIATDVPVSQILAEWARVGNTRIVNGDKLPGPNLTIQMLDRPEREVLDAVLRSAAGYVAAPRNSAVASLSMYDRILILPTSQAPAYNPAAAPTPTFTPPPRPMPMPMPVPDDDPVESPNVMQPGQLLPPGAVPQMSQPQATPGMPQTVSRPGMLPAPAPATPNPFVPGVVRPGGAQTPPGVKPPGGGGE